MCDKIVHVGAIKSKTKVEHLLYSLDDEVFQLNRQTLKQHTWFFIKAAGKRVFKTFTFFFEFYLAMFSHYN